MRVTVQVVVIIDSSFSVALPLRDSCTNRSVPEIKTIPKWQQKEQEKEPCVPVAQSPSPFSESSVFPLVEEADKVSEEYVPDEEELDLDPPIDLSGGIDCKTLTETPPEEI